MTHLRFSALVAFTIALQVWVVLVSLAVETPSWWLFVPAVGWLYWVVKLPLSALGLAVWLWWVSVGLYWIACRIAHER